MRQVEISSPSILQDQLWPAYVSLGLLTMWMPYVWPISYVCGALLIVMIIRKRIIRVLSNEVSFSIRQKEDLLFIDDKTTCVIHIDGYERIIALGVPLSIRLEGDERMSFENGSGAYDSRIEEDIHHASVSVVKRGPASIHTCVMRVTLPFHLGTLFFTDEGITLPSWIVLPAITKSPISESRMIRMGDRIVKHSPLKDPLMIQSAKRYEKEPAKQIDWVATSKTSHVQAKVYERQNLDTFTISLDLSGPLGNGLHAQYEDLIQQTAYWVSYLIKEDCKVELLINRLDKHNQIDHIVLGEGRKQLRLILVRLAMIHESNAFVASSRFTSYVSRHKQPHTELIHINYAMFLKSSG
ncbi:conserved hypothetical protein [Exiguobacterium sp. 8H]|uniref:DUF58 domain-containing protein n=1 Tax=unclassified Exiguobacterium TaxID=2644629 RepID=UPI0012F21A54|nr:MULTISPECIES: DUF58 domain-containing protein [unclassified Exiguobacterium]VXB20590.1 conserved hypothetical protein [Exiguobacterium sp. 8H]VXB21343.1 conserved hypothetical protein [Exiguobacterium sp. 8A]